MLSYAITEQAMYDIDVSDGAKRLPSGINVKAHVCYAARQQMS